MKIETLVRMANQIAGFFAAYSREQAIASVADHLHKFWDPRMRRAIIGHFRSGGAGLDEISLAAVGRLAAESEKAPAGKVPA
jgi:formate dehydrogenase subunit delta